MTDLCAFLHEKERSTLPLPYLHMCPWHHAGYYAQEGTEPALLALARRYGLRVQFTEISYTIDYPVDIIFNQLIVHCDQELAVYLEFYRAAVDEIWKIEEKRLHALAEPRRRHCV